MFSNHRGVKLEINNRKFDMLPIMEKLNNTLLSNQWVTVENPREIREYFEVN